MQRAPLPVYITTDMLGPNKPMPVILTDMNGAAKPTPIYDVNAGPDYYTKVESDERFANKSDTTVAINELRDDLDVNTLDIITLEQNLANVYTKAETYNKTEADNKFADKATTYTKSETYSKAENDTNFLHIATPNQVVSQVPFFNRGIGIGAVSIDIPQILLCAPNVAEINTKNLFIPSFDTSSATIVTTAPKTDQGINHRLKNAVSFQAPTLELTDTVPNILSIKTAVQTTAQTITIPNLASSCEVIVAKPNVEQIVTKRMTFDLGIRPSNIQIFNTAYTNAITIGTLQNDSTATKRINIPQLAGDGEFIITNSASLNTQELANGLKMPTIAVTDSAYFKSPASNNYAVVKSAGQTYNNATTTIPVLNSNSELVVTSPALVQTINSIRINALNMNGYSISAATNTISGATGVIPSDYAVKSYVDTGLSTKINTSQIVTTVTGSSDTNIPSEKAVKTYVDGHLSGGSIQSLTSLVWSTANWGTYLTLPDEMFNVEGYHKIALKIINNPGILHYGTFAVVGFPDYTSIRVQITGCSTQDNALSPEYQTVNVILSKTVNTEEAPYTSGSTNGTYFNNWVNGGDVVMAERNQANHGIQFTFSGHAANRIGTYTIETWVSFIV